MIAALISRIRRSQTASNTGIMMIGMGLRLIFQTLAFVLVSRFMGAAEFGAFGSVAALVAIIGAFSGWGSDVLIIKHVARSPNGFAEAWGSALVFLGVSAPPLTILAIVIVPLLAKASISPSLILYVVLADILFARVNVISAACYQAVERPSGTARLFAGFNGARLIAAFMWIYLSGTTAESWAAYYCGASAVFAVISVLLVWHDLGGPVWKVAWKEWSDGFHFSLLSASMSFAVNISTPVVALLSNLSAAGAYAAAIRVVEAAGVPFYAFTFSTFSRFFRAAATGGARESRNLAIRLLPVGLAASLIGTFGILLLAPIAPDVLGESYNGTNHVLKIVAVLPVIYAVYYLAADVLISSKWVKSRATIQCLLPLMNIVCCMILVPRYGAIGAAISVVIANAIMATTAWVVVVCITREPKFLNVEDKLT